MNETLQQLLYAINIYGNFDDEDLMAHGEAAERSIRADERERVAQALERVDYRDCWTPAGAAQIVRDTGDGG